MTVGDVNSIKVGASRYPPDGIIVMTDLTPEDVEWIKSRDYRGNRRSMVISAIHVMALFIVAMLAMVAMLHAELDDRLDRLETQAETP